MTATKYTCLIKSQIVMTSYHSFEASERYIKETNKKARKIYTFVDNNNISSIRMHEKLGYKRIEQGHGYAKRCYGWENCYTFVKELGKNKIQDNFDYKE